MIMSRAEQRRSAQNRGRNSSGNNRNGCGPFLAFILVIALLGAGLGVAGTLGYQWYQKNHNQPVSVEYPENPDYTSKDGSVLLDHVNDADLGDVSVNVEPDKKAESSINDSPRLAFKAISTPTDISFYKDTKLVEDVPSDTITVTLKYDPKLIPKGLNSRQVGMVVYDQNLKSWVPILNAKADPATNTVTARAPHFSWFSAIVLDPLQKTIEAAGKNIQSTVTNVMTVADWIAQVTQALVGALVDDITGTPPSLKCDPSSKQVQATTSSALDKLKGCTQSAGDNDTLKLSNGYAFPMLTDKLPKGVTLTMQDVWDNGANLPDMIRSLYWTSQNRAYISGAEISSMTVTPEMQQSATTTMKLDGDALSFDMGLAVLSLFQPEAAPAKKAVKDSLESIIKTGMVDKTKLDAASSWVSQSYDYADCVAGASHDLDEQPFSDNSVNTASGVAHDCLSTLFGKINLKGALAELLSDLKVIPATLQSLLYTTSAAVLESLPKQFDSIKMHDPTATVTRSGAAPKPSKTEKPKASAKPKPKETKSNEAAWGNFKSLVGSWKADVFLGSVTITIKPDTTGTYNVPWTKCTDNYDAGTLVNCKVSGGIVFIPNSRSIADWGVPKATNLDTGKNQPLLPEVTAQYKGQASYVTLSADKHTITFDGGPYNGVEFCDSYMYKYDNDANSPHWGRCSK
jgi:hypothetical protein